MGSAWIVLDHVAVLCYADCDVVTEKGRSTVRDPLGDLYTDSFNSIRMRVDTIIAVDPGKTGGIAIKFNGKYKVYKMPDSLVKIDDLLKHYNDVSDSMLVVIESIRLHNTGNMAMVSRMQKLFENYNQIKTLVAMNRIPFIEVAPVSWQAYLNLRTSRIKAMDRTGRKRAYRDFAQPWWPDKLNIDVADSVCLLIWAERNIKFNPDFEIPTIKERML